MLTGKYNDGIPEDSRINLPGYEWLKKFFESEEGQSRIEKARGLTKVSDRLGTTMARMALAWCLKNPNVSTVITGASKVEQLRDNLEALDVVDQLTDEVMQEIEDILQTKPKEMEFQHAKE
jgi:aryl-alcohol dehydrogenase-like predicted oxidoreductase